MQIQRRLYGLVLDDGNLMRGDREMRRQFRFLLDIAAALVLSCGAVFLSARLRMR